MTENSLDELTLGLLSQKTGTRAYTLAMWHIRSKFYGRKIASQQAGQHAQRETTPITRAHMRAGQGGRNVAPRMFKVASRVYENPIMGV